MLPRAPRDSERHEVLAELVAERLQSATEDTTRVASVVAVEVVPRLTKEHLAFLGLAFGVQAVCASSLGEGDISFTLDGVMARYPSEFREAVGLRYADYQYLASASCAVHGGGVIVSTLEGKLRNAGMDTQSATQCLQKSATGRWLAEVWNNGASDVAVNMTGLVIGTQVYRHRMKH